MKKCAATVMGEVGDLGLSRGIGGMLTVVSSRLQSEKKGGDEMAKKKGPVPPKEPLPKGVQASQFVAEKKEYDARLREGNFFYWPQEWISITDDRGGRSRRDGD